MGGMLFGDGGVPEERGGLDSRKKVAPRHPVIEVEALRFSRFDAVDLLA